MLNTFRIAALAIGLTAAGSACGGSTHVRAYVPVLTPKASFLAFQPQRLIVAGDGSELLTRIRYQNYGGPQTEASGTLLVDDCGNSCAVGTFHPVRASLRFGGLVTCHGKPVYTKLKIDAPGAPRFNSLRRQSIGLDYMAALCEPGTRKRGPDARTWLATVIGAPSVRRPSPHERAAIATAARAVWAYESSGRPTWAKPALYRDALLPTDLHPKVVSIRVSRTDPPFASAAVELWNARGRWRPGTAVVVFKWVGHRTENFLRPWDLVAGPATTFPLACTAATPKGIRDLLCPDAWAILGYRARRIRPATTYSFPLRSDDLHTLDWRNVSVPGAVCGTARPVELHHGDAFVHSLLQPWWSVIVVSAGWHAVSYGDLNGDGHDEAAIDVVCNNDGGMAAGQLAFASVIFTAQKHSLCVLGIIAPRQPIEANAVHVPTLGLVEIHRGKLIAHEAWYGPNDGTCCASGVAKTIWTFENARLQVNRTIVERRPSR